MRRVLSEEDVTFVCELVKEAGQLALKMRKGVSVQEKTGPHDRVTAADLALSQLIVSRLSHRFKTDVIISEEQEKHVPDFASHRMWMVDPIDGTDNYIKNDGQYAVMVGLVENLEPIFGWVYAPALEIVYYGGPFSGAWSIDRWKKTSKVKTHPPLNIDASLRVMMGARDRRCHPWINGCPNVTFVKAGSIGIKVAKIFDGQADAFIHLSGELKVWDTAGPAAIALGGGLEVGSLNHDNLVFPPADVVHRCPVVIGRAGSLAWCRAYLKQIN